MIQNKTKWGVLKVKNSTKHDLMIECKKVFLKNNPKFKGMHLSQNFLAKKVIDFYLAE